MPVEAAQTTETPAAVARTAQITPPPAAAAPTPPPAAAAPQKYKLGDEEYDEATLKKMVADAKRASEIEKGGRKAFEEASGLRKQFANIKDIVLQNPEAGILEIAKTFGLPEEVIDQIIAKRVGLQKQWEKMTPDQKARFVAEEKAAALEAEKSAREQEEARTAQEADYRQKVDAFEKKLANDTFPAMQEYGLEPSALKLKLVAATLGAIADREGPDREPDVREAVAYVAEAYQKDLDSSVNSLDPAKFVARYPELAKKLRAYEVSRATGKAPGTESRQASASRASPPENASQKNETWADFSKRMRQLSMGKRP
jgi:hypothetical protein